MAAVQVTAAQLPVVDPGAVDRIDLSTVVEHELGHVASPADLNALAGDVMSGARRRRGSPGLAA